MPTIPVQATDHRDARIPIARVFAEEVEGIGYCTPTSVAAAAPGGEPRVTLWQVQGARARRVPLADLEPLAPPTQPGVRLYGPPRAAPSKPRPAWEPGRYLFQFPQPGPEALALWFGLEVIDSAVGSEP